MISMPLTDFFLASKGAVFQRRISVLQALQKEFDRKIPLQYNTVSRKCLEQSGSFDYTIVFLAGLAGLGNRGRTKRSYKQGRRRTCYYQKPEVDPQAFDVVRKSHYQPLCFFNQLI